MKPETVLWLDIVDHDIRGARSLLKDGLLPGSAYFCQQAVEKLLKAVLTEGAIDFPKVHDLVELADLGTVDLSAEDRTFLTRLSDHAVRSRYPGAEYTEDDVETLLAETERFFRWLRARLS